VISGLDHAQRITTTESEDVFVVMWALFRD